MKIRIGPYTDRWTTCRFERWTLEKLHPGKSHFEVDYDEYTKLDFAIESVCDWWQDVLNATINRYLDNKKRKVKIQLDNYDTWNMDHTMALIIAPMLKQLRDTKHGSPVVDDEDVPEHLRSTAAPALENDWDTDDNFHKRWDWIMDELIWTFERLADPDDELQFYKGEPDLISIPVDEEGNEVPEEEAKFFQLGRGPKDTFEVDRDAQQKHYDRIENGLKLFGKYYRGLWD